MSTTLLALALLCGAARGVETSKTPETLLYVRTTPTGAEIRLDGKPLGTSDDLFPVQPGTYRIVVDLEGHEPQEQRITIRGGRITRLELEFKRRPAAPGEPAAGAHEERPRRSVALVVGTDRMTFQGEDTTWEELPKLLERIADREHTVLNLARAPGRMTAQQWEEARGKALGLVQRFGFEYLSDIGEHPLGSKWEPTHTLPKAKAQPPTKLPAETPARSIWDRVMNPPEGWTIEKSFIVPPDQTAAIGKKLGGPIKKLSNTIYSAHGQRVQVNVIECWTNPDAEEIHKSILARKGDPAYALEFGDTIVEFVGTFDVAFAKRAARELLQRPSDEPKEVSFGPVVEQVLREPENRVAGLVDLDTGRRAVIGEFGADDRQTHRRIREQKVDAMGIVEMGLPAVMLFDCAVYENPTISWERITPQEIVGHRWLNQTEPEPIVVVGTEDRSELPLMCLFETREGGRGVLQVIGLAGEPESAKIRYKLVQRSTPDLRTRAGLRKAERDVRNLAAAVEAYRLDVGSYPSTGQDLKALWQKPIDLPEPASWRGPYLKGPVPSDPWGRRYRYQSPDTFGGDMYVWSAGPDGVDGTDDDIGSWAMDEQSPARPAEPRGNEQRTPAALEQEAARETQPRAAPKPVEPGAGVEQTSWGEPVEGVQCRLRVERPTWPQGTVPKLLVDLRNRGRRNLRIAIESESWETEIDGNWHKPDTGWSGDRRYLPLGPGQHQSLEVWVPAVDNLARQLRTLKPGNHTLRVARLLNSTRRPGEEILRVVSNPIEIEIVPAAPAAEQAVREVVAGYVKAAAEGNESTVADLLHEKSRHILEQIDDMQEIVSAGMKPAAIDQVILRGDRALAATKPAEIRHRQHPRPVSMVYTLEKQGDGWGIRDVDVEDAQGLAEEIGRFREGRSGKAEAPAEMQPERASDT